MMRYATFDDAGRPTGFYSEDVHGALLRPIFGAVPEPTDENPHPVTPVIGSEPNPDCLIPAAAVVITDEQWQEFLENQGRRRWDGLDVVACEPIRPPITVSDVKAECRRRIVAVMSEDQQRNTLAAGQAAVMQFGADPVNWSSEMQARQTTASVSWAEIERLRGRSNELETLQPIPANFDDDEHWVEK